MHISVAVKYFTVLDPHSVYHRITIKKVSSVVYGIVQSIWAIPEIDPINVLRNLTLRDINNLIRVFLVNR